MQHIDDDFSGLELAEHWRPQTAVKVENGVVDFDVPQWGFHLVTKADFTDFVMKVDVCDRSGNGIGLIARWQSPVEYYLVQIHSDDQANQSPHAEFCTFHKANADHYGSADRQSMSFANGTPSFVCETWYRVQLDAAGPRFTLSVGEISGPLHPCATWTDSKQRFRSGAVGLFQAEGSHGEYRNFELRSAT